MTKSPSCEGRLIVALDFNQWTPALRAARMLRGLVRTLKVGSILFTAYGPKAVEKIQALGFDVMLDLKFHDIPSTVERSCEAAARMRVSLLTVHASGGQEMLKAAMKGARNEAKRQRTKRPAVLAVTVLTSAEGNRSLQIRSRVIALAQTALRSGCDGVVASAQDAGAIRRTCGKRLRIICPGIRPSGAHYGDQRRVCTPAEALAHGADALVVGRPVTEALQPRKAVKQIIDEMEG